MDGTREEKLPFSIDDERPAIVCDFLILLCAGNSDEKHGNQSKYDCRHVEIV